MFEGRTEGDGEKRKRESFFANRRERVRKLQVGFSPSRTRGKSRPPGNCCCFVSFLSFSLLGAYSLSLSFSDEARLCGAAAGRSHGRSRRIQRWHSIPIRPIGVDAPVFPLALPPQRPRRAGPSPGAGRRGRLRGRDRALGAAGEEQRGGREKKKKGASRREKKKRRKKKTTSWLEGKCVPSSSLSLTLMSPVGGRGAGEGLSGASGEEEREEEEVVEEEEEETAEEKLSMLLDEDAARWR